MGCCYVIGIGCLWQKFATISLKSLLGVYCTVVAFIGVTSAFRGLLGAKFTGWRVLGIIITLTQRDLSFCT